MISFDADFFMIFSSSLLLHPDPRLVFCTMSMAVVVIKCACTCGPLLNGTDRMMFRDAKSYGWIRDGHGLSHEPTESSITRSLKCNVVTRTSARGYDDGALVHGSPGSAAANLALRRYLWTHHGHSRQLDAAMQRSNSSNA